MLLPNVFLAIRSDAFRASFLILVLFVETKRVLGKETSFNSKEQPEGEAVLSVLVKDTSAASRGLLI